MSKKISDIKAACIQELTDFAASKPDWKYLKSKKTLVRSISKKSFVDIYTGMSSKVDFVNFEFSLHVGHKLVGKTMKLIYKYPSGTGWAVTRLGDLWMPDNLGPGCFTVYDRYHPHMKLFEEQKAQGRKDYVWLQEFPERFEQIFTLAEAEIEKVFDISSEEALIRSIVDKPIGFFRPSEVLVIQLLLGNPAYYDELLEFYDLPLETIRSLTREPLGKQTAELIMNTYRQGDFPKFDFV